MFLDLLFLTILYIAFCTDLVMNAHDAVHDWFKKIYFVFVLYSI